MGLKQEKYNARKNSGDYLSLLQLKLDCETIYNLITTLQHDGITSFGVIPYITLTTFAALELLEKNTSIRVSIPNAVRIKDVRLKLKMFEDGYSKSKRMLLNIDYLQDQIFKNKLRFGFMKSWNIHQNLGVYADGDKHVVGNTQYSYYLIQDNRLLKKSLADVAAAYAASPDSFDLNKQVGMDCYNYASSCGQIIGYVCSELKDFDAPVNILSKKIGTKYYCADYNSNIVSTLFPTGEDEKAMVLYLLHVLSTMNFLLFVLNNYEKDDYGWWLKINYTTYYYSVHKLRDLQQYLIQNKLMTPNLTSYFDEIDIDNIPYLNCKFRNYVMHSKLIDKDGSMMIDSDKMDRTKPLFGLVETCFDGLSYQEVKFSIISEMMRISEILSRWLNVASLHFKPFKHGN